MYVYTMENVFFQPSNIQKKAYTCVMKYIYKTHFAQEFFHIHDNLFVYFLFIQKPNHIHKNIINTWIYGWIYVFILIFRLYLYYTPGATPKILSASPYFRISKPCDWLT